MSKGGGAGKVYFVLYLAVVLELLIIIVERDEAEEGLLRKQQESMRIVESILSQLQSGSGTEGINTRPQDEITITPPGVNMKEIMGADIKSFRKYLVEVGVTDVSGSVQRKEGENDKEHNQRLRELVELANVSELQYQIFYSNSQDPTNAPMFKNDKQLMKEGVDFMKFQPGQKIAGPNGEEWQFMGNKQLNLDKEATYNQLNPKTIRTTADIAPQYPNNLINKIGPSFLPSGMPEDSGFYYSNSESIKNAGNMGDGLQKRSFVVNFQPPSQAGWYKLRFASRTNRILGVRATQGVHVEDEEATVNIGTVKLKVKDLRKVQKELGAQLEKYALPSVENLIKTLNIDEFEKGMAIALKKAMDDPNGQEAQGKIRLYSYIAKLLAPGMSSNFDQNHGAIEFNIRVILPKPTIADPNIGNVPDGMACFDAVQHVFDFTISPFQGDQNKVYGKVLDKNGAKVADLNLVPLDQIAGSNMPKPANGGKRDMRATVSSKLPPGQYSVELNHDLGSKKFPTMTKSLFVAKTGLTAESDKKLNTRLTYMAQYGKPLVIDVLPESGGKIPSNQFKTYVTLDNGSQARSIEGLNITQEMGMKFTPDAKKVTMRVTWIQPVTKQEVDIYPSKTFDIKQEEPFVNTKGLQITPTGNANKIRVTITGVKVAKPSSGSDKEVSIKVRSGEVTKISGLQSYQVVSEPNVTDEGESLTITFDLAGKLPVGETKVKGQMNLLIYVKAINPVNGKVSEEAKGEIPITISWEPDRGGPRRR